MTFDLKQIEASKLAYRRRLAALPFGEKLRLLDEMRTRDLLLRSAKRPSDPTGTAPHPPSTSDQ